VLEPAGEALCAGTFTDSAMCSSSSRCVTAPSSSSADLSLSSWASSCHLVSMFGDERVLLRIPARRIGFAVPQRHHLLKGCVVVLLPAA
jgi:hypothetical protein